MTATDSDPDTNIQMENAHFIAAIAGPMDQMGLHVAIVGPWINGRDARHRKGKQPIRYTGGVGNVQKN